MAGDSNPNSGGYCYSQSGRWPNQYLITPLEQILKNLKLDEKRLFEVGFGNGWTAHHFSQQGFEIVGIDPSESGVAIANQAYPQLSLYAGSVYDDLVSRFGQFQAVYSVEVIEHCQFPNKYASSIYDLLKPGGTAIITTPFHGYFKNLAIALLGKTDAHFNPLWEDGHLRFFSKKTLYALLTHIGFQQVDFHYAGRIRPFSKSIIAVAKK